MPRLDQPHAISKVEACGPKVNIRHMHHLQLQHNASPANHMLAVSDLDFCKIHNLITNQIKFRRCDAVADMI